MEEKDKALLSWWQRAVFTYENTDDDPASRLEAARLLASEARQLVLTSGSETCLPTEASARHDCAYHALADSQPLTVPTQRWSSSLNIDRAARAPSVLRLKEAKPLARLAVPPQFGRKSVSDTYGHTEEGPPVSHARARHKPGPQSRSNGHTVGNDVASQSSLATSGGLFSAHGSSSTYPAKRKPLHQSSELPSCDDSASSRYPRPTAGQPHGNPRSSWDRDSSNGDHHSAESHTDIGMYPRPPGPARQPANGGGRPQPPPHQQQQPEPEQGSPFITAHHQLIIDQQKKNGNSGGNGNSGYNYGSNKRSLGTTRRPGASPGSKFTPPVQPSDDGGSAGGGMRKRPAPSAGGASDSKAAAEELSKDERLSGLEPRMIELIMNEIMDHGPPVTWDDIAGLEFAKNTIQEIIVWPMLRPDIFTGLRGPPKGMLLFGPPGTGKTLIGKCIASQAGATFFSISASSLTSKWVGEGEKMVRALFGVARCHQPAVIFIDEIDSLLSLRSDSEHESSRRIKTEFLVQLDGATTISEDRLLVVGATNRPQEIDEAARRRLVKRLYIPLPDSGARQQIVLRLLSKQDNSVTEDEAVQISELTDGYSGADMTELCREAALGPIRSIRAADIQRITADQVPPICFADFQSAVRNVRASVDQKDLTIYLDWNKRFGSGNW